MIRPDRPVATGTVARHYDELDRFYRGLWGDHVHHGLWVTGDESPEQAVQQLVDRVATQAGLEPDDRVCDVGCGYGATARHLAEAYGARVTALTISPAQHRYARACLQPEPQPTYRLQDWLANDLPGASFDAVLMIESLTHMADPARALREAARVVRPGGRLVVCAWMAADEAPAWAERWLLAPICREGQLAGLPTASDLHDELQAAGFTSVTLDDLSLHVRRTWRIVLFRVGRALWTDPAVRRYLLDPTRSNRSFALTPLRLWLAFHLGVFRYGLFTAQKPA
ncbi:methyltransferase domain-containing protein [Salisaeta longa]|uniref:methyltransferase domain-containing protein n=1 Tax=Salisaeta longa TaxID=503170 RepID=UPI0003B66496|nr:methyltransferase domain-containing protein [Salisaeta longa]